MNNIMFYKCSVAPLYPLTDHHCRYFYSCFTKYIKLYTFMYHTNDLISKYKNNLMVLNTLDVPVAIQLVGNQVSKFFICAKIAQKLGYKEINLNIGCPSYNAYNNDYGVYLMSNKQLIIDCINAIHVGAPDLLVSLKQRLGLGVIDYNYLLDFIGDIANKTYCKYFIIHARTVLLNTFSYKKNLLVPKVQYNYVYKIKQDLPFLTIILNGDIISINDIHKHLKYVDGVMLGRGIYYNPKLLIDIHNYFLCQEKKITFFKNTHVYYMGKVITIDRFIYIILYNIYKYIILEIRLHHTNPLFIIKHVLYIFKGYCNASILRKKLILSIKKMHHVLNFQEFIKYIFY